MKYMLLIYADEQLRVNETPEETAKMMGEYMPLIQSLQKDGKYLAGSQLHPIANATSVRVRGGKRLTTDGPFAETREQLGGYFLIEAADLDEAIEIAGKIPSARTGTIEVRPIVQTPARATA